MVVRKPNPTDAKTYYQAGNDYYEKGEYDKAIENYNMAVLLNPVFSEAYFNRALSYYQLKNFEKAIADYTKAAELDPHNPFIYNNRGDAYYRLQDYNSAIKDYDKAIQINSNYLKAYYNRGLSYASLEDYDKAIEDFSKVIELKPDFAEAYHLRGLAKEYNSDLDGAAADYEQALKLNPELTEAKQHLESVKEKKEQQGKGEEGKAGADIKMLQKPNMTFADVAGMEKMKEEIRKSIVYPMINPDLARKYGKLGGGGILMYGPPGCGKCMTGETPVMLFNGGIKLIAEIYEQFSELGEKKIGEHEWVIEKPGIELPSFNPKTLKIEKKKVEFIYRQRYSGKIYRITTSSGRMISVTPEHPFISIQNGINKVKAAELSVGTYIAVPRILPTEPKADSVTGLSEEHADFHEIGGNFGYAPSEGSSIYGMVSFSAFSDMQYTHIKPNTSPGVQHLNYLEHLEIGSVGSTKFPNNMLNADLNTASKFLSAVFDCEAKIKQDIPQIEFTTASKEFVNIIAYLLLRFGIVASIKQKKIKSGQRTYWKLCISSHAQLKIFEQRIGFISQRKISSLKKWTLRATVGSTKSGIPSIKPKPQTKEIEKLRLLADSDVFWDRIESITEEDFEGYVYDLTVEDNHTFVAGFGGLIVHNTYIVKAAAGECKAGFINAKLSDLLDMYVGNTEKNIHKVFELARKNAPCILFFDEVDAIGGRRDQGEGQQYMRMAVNQMLYEMDGVEAHNENVLTIAATNAPWDVDPALRRSGRFSKAIYIPEPDFASRVAIIKMHAKKRPLAFFIPYSLLALATWGYASSDLKAVVDEAATYPWLEAFFSIQKKTEELIKKGMDKAKAEELAKKQVVQRPINVADFTRALIKKKSSLPPWYEQAKKQIGKQEEITIVDGKEHKKVTESKMGPGEREVFKDLLNTINNRNQWYMKIAFGIVKEGSLLLLRILSLIFAGQLVIGA